MSKVLEGEKLLDERNDTEQKKLKKVCAVHAHVFPCLCPVARAVFLSRPAQFLCGSPCCLPAAYSMFTWCASMPGDALRSVLQCHKHVVDFCMRMLQKPSSYRLACQTNVGNGQNSGKLRIRTKPK